MKLNSVSVIVPVYGDWPSLKECIESLIRYVDQDTDRVLLVNDCGPDVELMDRNIKRSIKGQKSFSYFRNKKNLGFVGTCNRAVNEIDNTKNDVMLLNSDTEVTQGFLSEMKAVLASDKIGVVSPRSNNATIYTMPISSINQKGIEAEKSYELFKKYCKDFPAYNITPTGHGFCMLIRRSLIIKYGLFDTVFGKGYGEEVDFCRRIYAHGWRCAISHKSYVFHLEARSFSLETKNKLLEQNNKIIRARYPEYKQAVTSYIESAIKQEAKILKTEITTRLQIKNLIRKTRLPGLVRSAGRRLKSNRK